MKKLTEKRLYNAALAYVAKYSASAGMVRDVLGRKLRRAGQRDLEVPPEASGWIDKIVESLARAGYVNDRGYAESVARRLSEQGKSAYFIRQKLALAHISAADADEALQKNTLTDIQRARILVAKKKLQNTPKDLAKLARAGFSYEVAKEALAHSDT